MSDKPTYKGEIAGFPAEVVEKMLERQFEQTGKRDVSVFEKTNIVNELGGGFDWESTIEHCDFWYEVITRKNFDVFFERYPKTKPQPELADLHKQISDLQARLDLAVRALEELMNSIPENRPLYKDSGLWQVRSDDMEYVYFQQGVNETFLEFVNRVTQIKGGEDENS